MSLKKREDLKRNVEILETEKRFLLPRYGDGVLIESTKPGWQSSSRGVSCGRVRLDSNNVRETNDLNAQLHGYTTMSSCVTCCHAVSLNPRCVLGTKPVHTAIRPLRSARLPSFHAHYNGNKHMREPFGFRSPASPTILGSRLVVLVWSVELSNLPCFARLL